MTALREYAKVAATELHRVVQNGDNGIDVDAIASVLDKAIKSATRERTHKVREQSKAAEASAHERLERLLVSLPAVIYSFKAHDDFAPIFVSNILSIFGYDRHDYLHDPSFWRDRVHPDDLQRTEAAVQRLFETGAQTIEYRFRHKDGSHIWVQDQQRVVRAANGQPLEIVGSWSDITTQKQLSETLYAARDRIRRLLATAPAVIYSFKATGDFAPTFVSDNIREWLGYTPKEYLESPGFWWNCVHPDDRAAIESASALLFRKGRHSAEYRFLKKDGSYCWVNDEQHLVRNAEGEATEVVGSWTDISKRKEAEAAAAEQGDRMEHLLASAPSVIYAFKARDDFAPTYISSNIHEVFGYVRNDYLKDASFWRDRVHPNDLAATEAAVGQLFETGSQSMEYRFRRKDGSFGWVQDQQRIIRDGDGQPLEVVGSWSDITARRQLGETLVAAQDRIVRLLSTAPAVIYSFKASGDFGPTFVSQNIRDWLGYDPKEYLESPGFWWNCVHPDDRAAVESASAILFRRGRHSSEYRFLKKDGSYCWVNDEQHLIRDDNGEAVEVVGSWTDITSRKEAEDAVILARDRMEHLLASAPAVIYAFKARDDFSPTFISSNIKDLLGYDREDYLTGADFWSSRLHPEDRPRVEKAYAHMLERQHFSSEYRFRKKDGSYCWVSDELEVLRDAAGDPIEVVGAWSDITARKQLGEALVAAQERLMHLLSSAPAVIYSFKATGDYAPTFVSDNIRDWLGYEPSEYLESSDFWWSCVHPDDHHIVEVQAALLFAKGRHTVEYRFRKRDGTYCWVNDEQHLIRDKDGNPTEVVGSWSDITSPKEAENALWMSERRLTDAIELVADGFALYDAQDRLIVCNKAYGELLHPGLGPPERGTPFEKLIRDAVARGLIDDAKENPAQWLAERLEKRRNPGEPHAQRRSDGRWIQVNERKTAEGGIIAVYTDITASKWAEEELRSAHRNMERANELANERNRVLELLSKRLSKYLSPQVYSSIFTGQSSVELASSRKKLTVFFSDIVDFTQTTDELESEELTNLLNHYLTEMSKIALEHGATIDKYIGDAFLAFFGDPETRGVKEDAKACARMAIAMQRRMRELQIEWRDAGLEKPFRLRIGINTGYCTVGNFGSDERMDYTIIGGEVNLASRLQSLAEPGGILISHETYSLVRDMVAGEEQSPIQPKGFVRPIRNYKIIDHADQQAGNGRLIQEEQAGFRIFMDLQKLDKAKAAESLESILSKLRA